MGLILDDQRRIIKVCLNVVYVMLKRMNQNFLIVGYTLKETINMSGVNHAKKPIIKNIVKSGKNKIEKNVTQEEQPKNGMNTWLCIGRKRTSLLNIANIIKNATVINAIKCVRKWMNGEPTILINGMVMDANEGQL